VAQVTKRQADPGRNRRGSAWRAAVLAVAVLAAAVAAAVATGLARGAPPRAASGGGAGPGARAQQVTVFPASSLAPARGALFGAWVQAAGYSGPGAEQAAVAAFERAIGRNLAIDSLYVAWAGPMPSAAIRWDLARGTVPMITWAAARTDQIAAGADDATIRARAVQLKAVGQPVLLRWFPEMDLSQNRAYAVSPAAFVSAWRRIHLIFQRAGADNVRWVWCPDSQGFARHTAPAYYPGNAYVDWTCADGYNWGTALRGGSWHSFQQIFTPFYAWARSARKPMLIGEFGTVEGSAGAKATWLAQAERVIQTRFPAIRAVVYFDSDHQNFGRYFDWKVTTSRSALTAFRTFAHDPYFSAMSRP
jgi:Glycosyl hydrolase family 26